MLKNNDPHYRSRSIRVISRVLNALVTRLLVCSSDGPAVMVLGVSNEAGHWGLCGLGLTSSMVPDHVSDLFGGFRKAAERSCQHDCGLKFAMTDAEAAYREGLANTFGSQPLMCYFHAKDACKSYIYGKARADMDTRHRLWETIGADIDFMHNAQCSPDFASRCATTIRKWREDGVQNTTAWVDRKGGRHDFVKYFEEYWLAQRSEFWWGRAGTVCPTTNNQAELCVKHTRQDAGGVVGSVAATIAFILKQVKFESGRPFDPYENREPSPEQWAKAVAFRKLFRSAKVQMCGRYAVCKGRPAPESIVDRPDVSAAEASWAVKIMEFLLAGKEVEVSDAMLWREYRVINSRVCSCFAHAPSRLCHHTVGFQLHLGEREAPLQYDDTAVAGAQRGKQRKAPGRYSVPLAADDKDKEIARLKQQLAAVHAGRTLRKPAAAAPTSQMSEVGSRAPGLTESTVCRICKAATLQGECWNPDCSLKWKGTQREGAPGSASTSQSAPPGIAGSLRHRLRGKTSSLVDYSDLGEKRRSDIIWGKRYFEKQTAAHCGMHALNNIAECHQFTLEFMEEACREVTLVTGDSASDHKSASGDWSFDVVARALELTVPPMLRVVARPVIAGDWGQFISSQEIRGIITNVKNKHWVALTKVGQHAFLVDSCHWPRVINEQEFKDIISSQHASFFVVPDDSALS